MTSLDANVKDPSRDETDTWDAYGGRLVTVWARRGTVDARQARAVLRRSERIVRQLGRLLAPGDQARQEPLRLALVVDPPPARADARRSLGHADGAGGVGGWHGLDGEEARQPSLSLPRASHDAPRPALSRAGEGPDADAVLTLREALEGKLAAALTGAAVARWFGEDAAGLDVVVEGLAGVAASRARTGPPVAEADRWLREQVAANHGVCLADRGLSTEEQSRCATSFVAYLLGGFGAAAVRALLAAHDPDRPDHGAMEAFHQPLGVLEEVWLGWLRRRGSQEDGLVSLLRRILPLLRPYRGTQVQVIVFLVLAAASNLAVPVATKWYLNHFDRFLRERGLMPGHAATKHAIGLPAADAGEFLHRTLVPFILVLFAVQVVSALVSLRRSYLVAWLNQQVLNGLQQRLFAHMQRLPHSFYNRAKIGDLMARLTSDLETIQQALSQLTNKGLYNLFTLLGGIVALFYTTSGDPSLALLTLLLVPIFALGYAGLRARNKQASSEQRARVGQTAAFTQEHLSAHPVVKAFGMEERVVAAYHQRLMVQQRSKLRLALLGALSDVSEDTVTALAQLIIFGLGGWLVLHDTTGSLGVGDLAASLMVVKVVFGPIASLSGIGQTVQQASGALQRVNELFEEPVEIADRPDAVPLPPLERDIRFERVTFGYEPRSVVLDEVDFTVPAGSHVAIVGPSGSGKTSTVNLLMRFWDPQGGRILVDGHDLRDVTLASLRGQTGIVQQDTIAFDTTVRENIRIGRPDATDAEVQAAAEAARLSEVIDRMPQGYDTVIGEKGVRMSGGQRQRLAIARAVLRNPRLLILDEATSALDPATEAGLMQTLIELARGRTTVSVTHRLSWARRADRIVVLDQGRVAEQGTHDELMARHGTYYRLYEEQMRDLGPAEPPAWLARVSGS